MIAAAGFAFERLEAFYLDGAPKFGGFPFLGAACSA